MPRTAFRHRPARNTRRLLLLGWLSTSLLFLGCLWTGVLGETGTVALDDYGSAIAPLLGAAACLRRSRTAGSSGRGWRLLGLSLLSWSLGGVAWTVYEVHLGRDVPFPSLADVGYLLSVPIAIAALLSFPSVRLGISSSVRPVLDGAIAAAALLFVSWATVLGPAFHADAESFFADVISLAYPVSDVLTTTMALLVLARTRPGQRAAMSMVAAGLLIVAIADSSFLWFIADGSYATGNLFDTGYVAGFLLIGVAALYPVGSPIDPEKSELSVGRVVASLPYLPVLVAIVFAVGLKVRGTPIETFLFYDGLFVVAAVLVRQLLGLQANLALSRQLHDTVAELRHREVDLQHQAFHDRLTGLANRALFADRLEHALARTRRGGSVVLLVADLDEFKVVNDTLGHPAGDILLAAVAERLRAAVRPEDTVARLGGDEFAVLLEDAGDPGEGRLVAERIGQAFAHPFSLDGAATGMSVSIGLAVALAGEKITAEELLRDADVALYDAKRQGPGRYEIYAADIVTAAGTRLRLRNDLTGALADGQLSLLYQPIVDLMSGQVTGAEALLRWTHPERGSVPATEVVQLAEDSGAILPIGRWVLQQACSEAGRWQRPRAAGVGPPTLSVNVSGKQLRHPQFLEEVQTALSRGGLPPARLTLEITESVLHENDPTAMEQLQALRGLGVTLALDGFGTGFSALDRLSGYAIDTVKIDKSFVDALAPPAAAHDVMVGFLIMLGRRLGLHVVAEGVETEAQLATLRSLGCTAGQGYLFARPAEAEIVAELISMGVPLVDPARRSTVHGRG